MNPEDRALLELGELLRTTGYTFVTPTPETHRRNNARACNTEARSVACVLGWSRPFRSGSIDREVERLLRQANAVRPSGDLEQSTVRFSTLAIPTTIAQSSASGALYVHSAYPTHAVDAVFFGPDTYRFAGLVRQHVRPGRRLVDVGTGCGAGGLTVRDRFGAIALTDISAAALRFARINVALAGALESTEIFESDVLASVDGPIDTVIANPPYLADAGGRAYRDGGGELGVELSVRIVREALARLAPGGQLVLYTGSPVVAGLHPLHDRLAPLLASRTCHHTWFELDPDVFGEELDEPAYREVDRIAAVGLVVDVA